MNIASLLQAAQLNSTYQQSSSGSSQKSNQQAGASVPQDTVTLSESMKDAQAGPKSNIKGGVGDVDHDGDSH